MPTQKHPQIQKKTGLSRITRAIATRIKSIISRLRSKFAGSRPSLHSSVQPMPAPSQPGQIPVHVANERTEPAASHWATPREPAPSVPDTADIVKRWRGAQMSVIKSMHALQDKQRTFAEIVDGGKGRSPGRHAGISEAGIAREQLVAAREGLVNALLALKSIDAERTRHQINEKLVVQEQGGKVTTSMSEVSLALRVDGSSRVKSVDELLASLSAGHPRQARHGTQVESSAPGKQADLKRLEKEGRESWQEVNAAIEMVDAACKQRPHFLDPKDPHVARLDAAIEKRMHGLMEAIERLRKGELERLKHGYDPFYGEDHLIPMSVLSDRLRAEAIKKLEVAETLLRYSPNFRHEEANVSAHEGGLGGGRPPTLRTQGQPQAGQAGDPYGRRVMQVAVSHRNDGRLHHHDQSAHQYRLVLEQAKLNHRRQEQPATGIAAQASLDPAVRVRNWIDVQNAPAIVHRQGSQVHTRGGPSR